MKSDQPYDPSTPLPNTQHEIFAQARFAGDNAANAYRKANPKSVKWGTNARCVEASRLDAAPNVRLRIQFLQKAAASAKVATKQEALETLTEMMRTTLADYMTQSADGVWFHDFGPDTARKFALKKIKTRTEVTTHGRGENKAEDQAILTEVELESRVAVINKLAEMLGWNAPTKVDLSEILSWDRVIEEAEKREAAARLGRKK